MNGVSMCVHIIVVDWSFHKTLVHFICTSIAFLPISRTAREEGAVGPVAAWRDGIDLCESWTRDAAAVHMPNTQRIPRGSSMAHDW